jgi:prophage tail gpP-like protein
MSNLDEAKLANSLSDALKSADAKEAAVYRPQIIIQADAEKEATLRRSILACLNDGLYRAKTLCGDVTYDEADQDDADDLRKIADRLVSRHRARAAASRVARAA